MRDHDFSAEQVLSVEGTGESFNDIMARRISRRGLLKGGLAASALVMAGANLADAPTAEAQSAGPRLNFQAIQTTIEDKVQVAAGHKVSTLIRWGDPIKAEAAAFDLDKQTSAAQAQQFGYNCDFVGFMPLPAGGNSSSSGLLVVNHEYTDPTLMFPKYDAKNPTKEQVDIDLAAHGIAVVEVARGANSQWSYRQNSTFNRRITGTTPIDITGPAAGHDWLKTKDDPTGTKVAGTLNNCAAGKTPWGTVLSAEENFNQYFANYDAMPESDPRKAGHKRIAYPAKASERQWEKYYDRFDIAKEPNEAFRFGWVVEVDPYDPNWTPKKRTALGRFKHEAATSVVSTGGKVVLYSGDDERFDYVYKFVAAKPYNASDRTANRNLLDEGTLYVAKFNDDGSGEWLHVVFGQGPLTAANGFENQGKVLINTRLAGDRLGATKMDRPEDIEVNPVNKKVYIICTNNSQRGTDGRAATDKANPRKENRHGHIIEVTEDGNDHAATKFKWEIFMLCGDPADASTYFAGFDKSKVSIISSPDNMVFDNDGNIWIATDGMPSSVKLNDGLYGCPVAGPERGHLKLFFTAPPASEVCGPEFTPDNTSIFLAIQHPGEGSTPDKLSTMWPDGKGMPKPSIVVIQTDNGGRIGNPVSQVSAAQAQPTALPTTGGLPGVAGQITALAGLGLAAAGALAKFRERGQQARNSDNQPDQE